MAVAPETTSISQSEGLIARIRSWLSVHDRDILRDLTGPLSYMAPVVWVLTFIHPKNGLSVSLCQFHSMTGLCCPGCGMTRSLSSISHLDFASAWHYHPFGFIAYAFMVLLSVRLVLPKGMRRRVARFEDVHCRKISATVLAFSVAFVLYGIWRIAAGVTL